MAIQVKKIIVSFDVVNFFPSVPVKKAVEITDNLLIHNRCISLIKNDLLSLLPTCLTQNYFEFNN